MATKSQAGMVGEEFYCSLSDLKQNSKPHINMLTMLADENMEYANEIIEMLSKHINETNHKLSAMYLIDSILKNVGKDYNKLLGGHIVAMFSTVFNHGDEVTRKKLYELRQTWSSIFPPSRLYFLDMSIQGIDPAWPLTASSKLTPPLQTIHFNPKFKGSRVTPELLPTLQNNVKVSEFAPAFPVPTADSTKNDDLRTLLKLQNDKKVLKGEQKTAEKVGTIHVAPWKAKQFGQLPIDVKSNSSTNKPSNDFPSKSRDPRIKENRSMGDKGVARAENVVSHNKISSNQIQKNLTDNSKKYDKVTFASSTNKDTSTKFQSKRKYKDCSSHSDKTEKSCSVNEDETMSKKQKIDTKEKSVLNTGESKSGKEGTTNSILPSGDDLNGGQPANNLEKSSSEWDEKTIDEVTKNCTISSPGNIPSTLADSEEEKILSETTAEPSSLKRALEESGLNGNDINNKKVCLEEEVNPTINQQTPIEDVDLRKLSMPQKMVPLSTDSCDDSEFSLFGKEDIDYRQLQFPPMEVQPRPSLPPPPLPPPLPPSIFPVPPIAALPGIIPNYLPGIVPNTAMILMNSKSQHIATMPSSSSSTAVIPSFDDIHNLPSPSQSFEIHSQEVSSVPTNTELVFDELAAGVVSNPIIPLACTGNASSLISSSISVPPVTVMSMVGEQSIDLSAVGNEIDSDIMCLDDTRNTYLRTCPVTTERNDTYYGIMADIHDQVLWQNISRKEYNTLVVRLLEYSQRNQLDYYRSHYMSNMKGPPPSYVPKFNPNSSHQKNQNNSNKENEEILPTVQFSGQNASDSDYTFSQNVNYYPKETISQPTDLFFVNNTRPYTPFTSDSSQQVCKGTYTSSHQYHPPANMVPQIRAPETSISILQSILANVGQVNAVPPTPQRKERTPNRYVRGRNKRNWNRHCRTEPQMVPVENDKWLPQKDDMWNTKFLKRRNDFLIRAIYYGIQCSSCGLRFKPEEKEKYSRHLDWHFRMNKKQQESLRKVNYTNWFVAPQHWKLYEEMDFDEPSGSVLFDEISPSDGSEDGSAEQEEIPSVAVSSDDAHLSMCPQCHEKFKNFFHQDLEEWHYTNAIERNGLNYHPMCYEDVEKRRQRLEREYNESSMSPQEICIDDSICESNEDSTLVENSSLTQTPLQIISRILDDGGSTAASVSSRSNYIKQETISIEDGIDMFLPPPMPRILADLPLKMEIKEECDDDISEGDISICEDADIQEIENQSSEVVDVPMNSTVEVDLSDIAYDNIHSPVVITRQTPLIRINIAKNQSSKVTEEPESPKVAEGPTNVIRDLIKPAFEGVTLIEQEPVNRGMELTSLCSIM